MNQLTRLREVGRRRFESLPALGGRPGSSTVELLYDLPWSPSTDALVGRAIVDPDDHYRGVFTSLLGTLRDPGARQIEDASQRISTSQ